MGRTLEELGATMSAAEFRVWAALYKVYPWDEHTDLGFGQVCATIANYAGKVRSDGAEPARASDFMPLPVPPDIEPDPLEHFGAL